MFSLDQSKFTFQDGCCWLVCVVTMLHNNTLKRAILQKDIDDISRFVLHEYGFPMLNTGAPIQGGISRIKQYTKKYFNKDTSSIRFKLWSPLFRFHLDSGKVMAIKIQSSKEFKNMWKNTTKIQGDFTNTKGNGHRLCIFKKDGKYYFLNSRYGDERDIKEVDQDVVGLFTDSYATLFY